MTQENYICVSLEIPENDQELWIYNLSEMGFEGFEQDYNVLKAYIAESLWNKELLNDCPFPWKENTIEPQNWNDVWESNYESIFVGDLCEIHPTHIQPVGKCKYTIHIQPQMSFGTGHHFTTRLMIQQMNQLDFKDKVVMDMGSGTGILAIFAALLGAKHVWMIDIESWAAENAIENSELNHIKNYTSLEGDVNTIPDVQFDVFLANINRNILLQDGEQYCKRINKDGYLLISGFFDFDVEMLTAHFESFACKFINSIEENGWVSILFQKS